MSTVWWVWGTSVCPIYRYTLLPHTIVGDSALHIMLCSDTNCRDQAHHNEQNYSYVFLIKREDYDGQVEVYTRYEVKAWCAMFPRYSIFEVP